MRPKCAARTTRTVRNAPNLRFPLTSLHLCSHLTVSGLMEGLHSWWEFTGEQHSVLDTRFLNTVNIMLSISYAENPLRNHHHHRGEGGWMTPGGSRLAEIFQHKLCCVRFARRSSRPTQTGKSGLLSRRCFTCLPARA